MKTLLTTLFFAAFGAQPMFAQTLPSPTGDVILTITGSIENQTSDGKAELDLDLLKRLPQVQFSTSTIWMEGVTEFTGVPLQDLLEYVGAKGTTIQAVALNDYKIEIPTNSVTDTAPIVAYLMDGAEMSPRGKGPLWVVYPYDTDASYRTEVIYSRSIWQLDRIIIGD